MQPRVCQILLISDNPQLVASLEGALGRPGADPSALRAPSRGQFRLQRLSRLEELERRLPDLLATVDGAIVDGTAPLFSNGQLERALMLLDRGQLGSVLLTPGRGAGPAGPEGDAPGPATSSRTARPSSAFSVTGGRGQATGRRQRPGSALAGTLTLDPRPSARETNRSALEEMPLVWPVPADRPDLVAWALTIIAGHQQVVRSLQREIRAFQRLDTRLTGQFNEIDEEMRLASRIQQDFLPKTLPAVGPARFATLYRPASWVSGDLYDVFRLDETHVGFYIADAVGHGMPAALLTMFIKRSMETKQIDPNGYRLLGPEETMRSLNGALLEASLAADQFTTAVYALLDLTTLKLQLARGGHPHPIWLHHDGTTSEPEAEGGLLGVFPETRFARADRKSVV